MSENKEDKGILLTRGYIITLLFLSIALVIIWALGVNDIEGRLFPLLVVPLALMGILLIVRR